MKKLLNKSDMLPLPQIKWYFSFFLSWTVVWRSVAVITQGGESFSNGTGGNKDLQYGKAFSSVLDSFKFELLQCYLKDR